MTTLNHLTYGLLLSLCFTVLAPTSQAARSHKDDDSKSAKQKYEKKTSKGQDKAGRRDKYRTPAHKQGKSSTKNQRQKILKKRAEPTAPARRERTKKPDQRGLWPYPKRSTLPKRKPHVHDSHEHHYDRYSAKLRKAKKYHAHETYRYHTHYLAPIHHHYHPIGHRIKILPRTYIRIVVSGLPYFYLGGVFYRSHSGIYVVVRAPIGAYVEVLPIGFISFHLGGVAYYYVNDTYYIWDDYHEHYVVVKKPAGADRSIASATEGRLFIYPNKGQSEKQQAKDRYECHRWAVHQTDVDPTLEDEEDISTQDRDDYRRAISACLEGSGYTVK